MNKIKVFLVDDHLLFREGTRNIIEKENDIEVIGEASNGKEALESLKRLSPNIAIVDISMPELNGIELTRQLKKTTSDIAVLILTAYDNDQYVFAMLEAGAAGYLLKNVSGQELIRAIRSIYDGESVLHPVIARKVFSTFTSSAYEVKRTNRPQELTDRELEILKLAANGLDNQDIADQLYLSRRTVQAHLGHIFRKMEVASRTEAIMHALKKRWFTLEDLK